MDLMWFEEMVSLTAPLAPRVSAMPMYRNKQSWSRNYWTLVAERSPISI